MPSHHMPDEVLLQYAAGNLEEAEALMVASHASLCPRCAQRVQGHERVGGALLASETGAPVADDLLERTLALLDTQPRYQAPEPVHDPVLPAPLARLTGPFDKIVWTQSLKNTRTLELPLTLGGIPVRLRRFLPGTTIPMHTHRAVEYDLILTGGITDERDGRHMVRGDVSVNDERDAHRLTIDRGEECVALSVHGARVKPLGLWSRIVFGYTGW